MSIPLERLYHYLDSLCGNDILIYRWAPHGSKKLTDLIPLKTLPDNHFEPLLLPVLVCHDQEPLDYKYYTPEELLKAAQYIADDRKTQTPPAPWCYSEEIIQLLANSHLRVRIVPFINLNDYVLLCHSEKNSNQLKIYEQNGFFGVYYWSHGLIARDWFRYAECDRSLAVDFNLIKTDFLIYNRAWQGTREYRLKFTELLVEQDLVTVSNVKFSEFDGNVRYTDHKFKNNSLSITSTDLEQHIDKNVASSSASADYDSNDYLSSAIEVVLETIFDDTRHHLTEKTLRPIACGRPFILVSTPGILGYLKSYGFKTFDGLINESYDLINDPVERLIAIIAEMKRIATLDPIQKHDLLIGLYSIADYNKQHFFSDTFHNMIVDEFIENLNTGLNKCRYSMTGKWWKLITESDYLNEPAPVTELSTKINNWLLEYNFKN